MLHFSELGRKEIVGKFTQTIIDFINHDHNIVNYIVGILSKLCRFTLINRFFNEKSMQFLKSLW